MLPPSPPPLGLGSGLLFIFVTIAAAALTIRRPIHGVALFILLDPFAFAHRIGPSTISLPKALLVGLGIGILARGAPFYKLFSPIARPLLGGSLAVLFATAISIAQADFLAPALRETLKSAEYLAAFVCISLAVASDPSPRVIRWAIAVVTSLVSLLALSQEFGGAPQVVAVGGHLLHRIAGPLEGPNQLAGYLGLLLPLLLAELLREEPGILRSERFFFACALLLGTSADILTFSRAGVVSLLVGSLVVVWIVRRRIFATTLAALFLLVIAIASSSHLGNPLHHFLSAQEVNAPSGLGTRSQLWPAALMLWRQHPWLGIGAGNFELELSRVGLADLHTHANSLPLQALVEGGIPLAAAVFWTVYASIATWLRATRLPLIAGILGGSIALAFHQLVDLMVFYPKVGDAWWTLLGIGVGSLIAERSNQDATRTRPT